MNDFFEYDSRLGIHLPNLEKPWNTYDGEIQQSILFHWEKIRGKIPDRIAELEASINVKQEQLGNEDDFERSCQLNSEISELASIINDLWLWFRLNQTISSKAHM